MIYTAIDTFYLTQAQLEDSSSRKDGIDSETETTLRIYGAELVQEAGILLKLPQVVMATGQVLLHRFFAKQSFARYNVKRVAASCVWLAAKLEEVPRRIRDILFVFHRINQRREGLPIEPLEQFSKAYDGLRVELIRMERHLLKEMGFICHVEHPHKFIPIYLEQLGVQDSLVQQEAWSLANDSLRTTLCVQFKSEVVACGVIYAATRRARIPLPENPAWWLIFDASKPQIDEICRALADLYRRPKAVYVEVGKEHSTILSTRAWEPPADTTKTAMVKSPTPPIQTSQVSAGLGKEEVAVNGPADGKIEQPKASCRPKDKKMCEDAANGQVEEKGPEKPELLPPKQGTTPNGVDLAAGECALRPEVATEGRSKEPRDRSASSLSSCSEDDDRVKKRARTSPGEGLRNGSAGGGTAGSQRAKKSKRGDGHEGEVSEEVSERGSSGEDGGPVLARKRKTLKESVRNGPLAAGEEEARDLESDEAEEGPNENSKRRRRDNGHRRDSGEDNDGPRGEYDRDGEYERRQHKGHRRRGRDETGEYDRKTGNTRDRGLETELDRGRNGSHSGEKGYCRDGSQGRRDQRGGPREGRDYREREGGSVKRPVPGGYDRPRNGRPDARLDRDFAGSRLQGRLAPRGK